MDAALLATETRNTTGTTKSLNGSPFERIISSKVKYTLVNFIEIDEADEIRNSNDNEKWIIPLSVVKRINKNSRVKEHINGSKLTFRELSTSRYRITLTVPNNLPCYDIIKQVMLEDCVTFNLPSPITEGDFVTPLMSNEFEPLILMHVNVQDIRNP